MRRARRKVVFSKQHGDPSPTEDKQRTTKPSGNMTSSNIESEPFVSLPDHFTHEPLIRDDLSTETSIVQDETVQECMPLINGINDPSRNPFDFNDRGVPLLNREDHVEFAHGALEEYPSPFIGIDASRPWMIYWSLLSLHLLEEDVHLYRESVVKTFYPLQNKSGGFGGGQGHLSHLAPTYATLLSLALVGGEEAYTLIDRPAMWHWLGRMKQFDGGFCICEDGEEDVRGAYCALVAISLLDLPWELPADSPARVAGMQTFGDGLGEHLSRCQTYEGGISSAPGHEAHGAYTFCALACLCLLDSPDKAMNQFLDVPALVSWLSARQYAPEGGLAGRTNKLVDGCYSHWIGGCWPLVQAAVFGPVDDQTSHGLLKTGNLFSTDGLSRYILGCCQNPRGGLRDKPSKRPDAYHTCYNLVGLNISEYFHCFHDPKTNSLFATISTWTAQPVDSTLDASVNGDLHGNTNIKPLHPVYVIPDQSVRLMREWFQEHKITFEN